MAEDDYLGWVEMIDVLGAYIFLDDKTVGALAKPRFQATSNRQTHVVDYQRRLRRIQTRIQVIAGETAEIKAQLSGDPVGKLDVRGYGIEDATIYVDGKAPCERGPVPQERARRLA